VAKGLSVAGSRTIGESRCPPCIVRAEESQDRFAVSKTHDDRKDALATAVQWESEGRKVKIIGNGKIYTAAELAISIINNE
jgi:hypothetical protein